MPKGQLMEYDGRVDDIDFEVMECVGMSME